MRPLTKLEKNLQAVEAHLAFYDGLHEGTDNKIRKALKDAIAEIKSKIGRCQSGDRADA